MGTNYYLHIVGIKPEVLHIGKSAYGWCFSLHVYPERDIYSLKDYEFMFEHYFWMYIKDEYGETIPVKEMLSIIKDRKYPMPFGETRWDIGYYKDEDDFHAKNSSQRGPNNLLRHQIDGRYCVGHGEGTWDHIGEFS
jgi:hypothetical protein